ncbi:MAG TPA: potassium-transporting ATPase subunit C, partial [Pseudomonas sp.]|nr:potassium-transporting ATPase subunit C [Pseudomonas sp.]
MNTYVRPALSLILLMTVVTGALYPLAVTGIAQVAFPEQANGSLVRDDQGQVRGSALIAQGFQGDGWFHSRPSAGGYATVASSASNLSPSNPALAERVGNDAAMLYQAGQGPVPQALL